MLQVDDNEFTLLVEEGIDKIPEKFKVLLDNVVISWADVPTPEQLSKAKLRRSQGLFGLYEGVPQTARGAGYSSLPDRITIFRQAILHSCRTADEARDQVAETVWHELAHHFGSSEERVRKAQQRRRSRINKFA